MYSRETGFSSSRQGYSADKLREKYAAKTVAAAQRSPFKQPAPELQSESILPPEPPTAVQPVVQPAPPPEESGIKDYISSLAGDDLLMLAVLALLLFSGGEKKNFDIVLAAALLFVEFA